MADIDKRVGQAVRLTGADRAVAVLNGLERKTQKRILPKAVRAAGAPFLKAARRFCPKGNRLLSRSLALVMRRYSGSVLVVIGQEKTKRFDKAKTKIKRRGGISGRGELTPLHLVEEDVKPHAVRPRSAKWLRAKRLVFQVGGKTIYTTEVQHPGRRGDHFVRAAAVASEAEGVRQFTDKLATEVMKEARPQ